jgi:cytochrome c553
MPFHRLVLILILFLTFPAAAQPLQERLAACLACHGENGESQTPEVPSLGGQPAMFVTIELFMFREAQRRVEIMNDVAKGLTNDDLRQVSDVISKLPPPKPPADTADPGRMERGRALAQQHRCASCHNPDYSGREQMPRLAHQREDYLAKALRDYKSGARPGYDAAMAQVLYPIDDAQIADLAHYLAHFR